VHVKSPEREGGFGVGVGNMDYNTETSTSTGCPRRASMLERKVEVESLQNGRVEGGGNEMKQAKEMVEEVMHTRKEIGV